MATTYKEVFRNNMIEFRNTLNKSHSLENKSFRGKKKPCLDLPFDVGGHVHFCMFRLSTVFSNET